MLYRKIIDGKSNALDFSMHDVERNLKTRYIDQMAAKYCFSSQAVVRSGIDILENGIDLIIRFREPTRIKLNENEFFEVINMYFYYDRIMYMIAPGGKMHHVNGDKVYAITNMREE